MELQIPVPRNPLQVPNLCEASPWCLRIPRALRASQAPTRACFARKQFQKGKALNTISLQCCKTGPPKMGFFFKFLFSALAWNCEFLPLRANSARNPLQVPCFAHVPRNPTAKPCKVSILRKQFPWPLRIPRAKEPRARRVNFYAWVPWGLQIPVLASHQPFAPIHSIPIFASVRSNSQAQPLLCTRAIFARNPCFARVALHSARKPCV